MLGPVPQLCAHLLINVLRLTDTVDGDLVVGKHQLRNLVGHRLQQLFALVGLDLAGGDQRVDQDLDVDLVVGTVHAGGVVQRVGVDTSAGQIEFHASECRHPEIAAFADNLGAHLISVDPDRIVGAITDIGGKHEGTQVTFDALGKYHVNSQLTLEGGPGITWGSSQYNETFYGVTQAQSASSGLATASPGAGLNAVRMSGGASYHVNKQWSVNAKVSLTRLPGDVGESPIVQKRTQLEYGLFVVDAF